MCTICIVNNLLRLLDHLGNIRQDYFLFIVDYEIFGLLSANWAFPLSVGRYYQEWEVNLEVETLGMGAVNATNWVFYQLLYWWFKRRYYYCLFFLVFLFFIFFILAFFSKKAANILLIHAIYQFLIHFLYGMLNNDKNSKYVGRTWTLLGFLNLQTDFHTVLWIFVIPKMFTQDTWLIFSFLGIVSLWRCRIVFDYIIINQ